MQVSFHVDLKHYELEYIDKKSLTLNVSIAKVSRTSFAANISFEAHHDMLETEMVSNSTLKSYWLCKIAYTLSQILK